MTSGMGPPSRRPPQPDDGAEVRSFGESRDFVDRVEREAHAAHHEFRINSR